MTYYSFFFSFSMSSSDNHIVYYLIFVKGLPGGSDGKKSACNVGDLGLIPG